MKIHAFTSFTFCYLNRARVLAKTLRRHHPDWVIWAVIVDRPPVGFEFDLSKEDFDRVITVEMLFGEITTPWLFGHDIVEACTAVKAQALRHIMADSSAEKILYFDPDIAIFNQMNEVVDLLDHHSIILTPHQVDPELAAETQAILDNEVCSLHYGIFNLGFIAVNKTPEARKFIQWWADRLFKFCHDRLDIGIFVDQKWCNLIPCFFDGVKVLRDPGYNVASWNLSQREMTFDMNGQAQINGSPLRFFHFTKLGPTGDAMTLRYARGNMEVHELWAWYRQEVLNATDPLIPQNYWYYGIYNSGRPIDKSSRIPYRNDKDLLKRGKNSPNPFMG